MSCKLFVETDETSMKNVKTNSGIAKPTATKFWSEFRNYRTS